jgi:potassium large conductance calcium-activated channel subfamily M alpha protein 1
MSNLRAFSKEETPEIEAQALLRKGVRKHQDPGPSLLMPDMDNKHCNTLDMPKKTKRFVITLEDAIDMAMSWPPLQILDKPDPSIIERRRAEVYKSLKTSTLNVVKLSHPHILVCIQGKWPSSLFYFVSQLRTPGMPNPPIVILHPNEPSIADWGCVGVFQHIYFVIGSPSYELDLLRAGVLQAGAAIHSSFQLFQ